MEGGSGRQVHGVSEGSWTKAVVLGEKPGSNILHRTVNHCLLFFCALVSNNEEMTEIQETECLFVQVQMPSLYKQL